MMISNCFESNNLLLNWKARQGGAIMIEMWKLFFEVNSNRVVLAIILAKRLRNGKIGWEIPIKNFPDLIDFRWNQNSSKGGFGQ